MNVIRELFSSYHNGVYVVICRTYSITVQCMCGHFLEENIAPPKNHL